MEWAKQSKVPLSTVKPGAPWDDWGALGAMVEGASIVALSEGVHGAAEPLEFRNRLLEYLVRQQGFSAVAIESGIVESRVIYDYINGGAGDLETVVSQGFSWTFDRLPQNRDLVRWLRDYNRDASHARKIRFYGFDVPGSPGNPRARRGVNTALACALGYLGELDGTAAAEIRARLDPLWPNLRFAFCGEPGAPGYHTLTEAERNTVTAAIADAIGLLERCQLQYEAASTAEDFDWALRAAIGARQADQWLRQLPNGWKPSREAPRFPSEQTRFLSLASDIRDRAQADNLDWIIDREGPAGKVLVFASRFHLSTAAVRTTWSAAAGEGQVVSGMYLRRRHGPRLRVIGNLIGQGEYFDGEAIHSLKNPDEDSIEGLTGQVGGPAFLLDLHRAPAHVARWLDQTWPLGTGEHTLQVNVAKAFDVLLYLDTVSPA